MLVDALLSTRFPFEGQFAAQKDGTLFLSSVIAERKVFLSRKSLSYRCRVRINDAAREVLLFEVLEERGSGLTTGNDDGEYATPGFGFKVETYNTTRGTRNGAIEEQSALFGKTYSYKFDYAAVRKTVQDIATANGYTLRTTLIEREVIKKG
ncbi:MAG: hypothetical protein WAW16_00780 [Candidatus Cryosericum sp.]